MKKAVASIVACDGYVLMGRKAPGKEYLAGMWHVPVGKLKEGESDEAGLKRVVMEKAGIEIHVLGPLAEYKTPKNNLVTWYGCEPLTFNIKAGSDLDEIRWMSKLEAKRLCDPRAKDLWPKEIKDYFNKTS